jgi:hypothetical protein
LAQLCWPRASLTSGAGLGEDCRIGSPQTADTDRPDFVRTGFDHVADHTNFERPRGEDFRGQ